MGNSQQVEGRAPIHLFASSKSWIEGSALRQLEQVAALDGVQAVAAMPDLHPGKYSPVGCAILADRIYPQLVGSDIGCGMGLFRLDEAARKLRLDKLAERLRVLEEPWPDGREAAADADLPASGFDGALGSIGGGNHFCEVQAIETIVEPDAAARAGLDPTSAYLLVHSGSRGLGYSIMERNLAAGIAALEPAGEAGAAYLRDHDHAVSWARLNRRIIASRAAEAARADLTAIADLSHNHVETNGPSALALHRKGAAPADRGLVPVPGSRGTLSYLVEPLARDGGDSLASLAHGAGRKYDRSAAHGRVGARKSDLVRLARNPFGGFVVCEDKDLLIEEAPDAYKNIDRVIADLEEFGLARVVATFKPLITFKRARTERGGEAEKRRGPRRESRR